MPASETHPPIVATLLLLSLALGSCSPPPLPTLTPTTMPPAPTRTPAPTPTASPTPRHLPTPTGFIDRVPLPAAGFSFVPTGILYADFAPTQAMMSNMDQTFLFSLAAGSPLEGATLDDALSSFLSNMKRDFPDLENGPPIQAEVSGQVAIASDIRGSLGGHSFSGRITVVQPAGGLPVYALALAIDPPVGKGWEPEGEYLYIETLETVNFFEPTAQSADCQVSSDPTYAFERSNPVRVGGQAFGGPDRERAYLDTILGPNGEPVSYKRSGSSPFEDTILDFYVLTYPGIPSPVTIYLDESSFETLYAPLGFSCASQFPVMPQ